jgi:hypothetical protein
MAAFRAQKRAFISTALRLLTFVSLGLIVLVVLVYSRMLIFSELDDWISSSLEWLSCLEGADVELNPYESCGSHAKEVDCCSTVILLFHPLFLILFCFILHSMVYLLAFLSASWICSDFP